MKNNIINLLVLMVALTLTGCIHNLNTEPIDKNSSTSFNEARMFSKCYATLGLTGQEGPAGDQDVEDIDEGFSAFYRSVWYCNELPTDEAWWLWNDEELLGMRNAAWTGETVQLRGIYTRLNLTIKYCNHYLNYASSDTDEARHRLAEIRFIRALNIYYLMDFFLYAPKCLVESSDYPHYWSRWEMYAWLVEELKDLTVQLPDHRYSLYRVDKAAANLLLARVYLNADVYNRLNPEWEIDKTWTLAFRAAEDALACGYDLYTNDVTTDSGFVYSAYQQLFMADNHRDEVAKEFPLTIYQDGIYCRSYGGAGMVVSAPRTDGMVAYGAQKTWTCIRTSPTFVYTFTDQAGFSHSEAKTIKADEYHMPAILHDDRAILCSYVPGMTPWSITGSQTFGDNKNFFDCWVAPKFTNVTVDAALPSLAVGHDKEFPDVDLPLMRIAEAYLIKAEVLFRTGDSPAALNIINTIIRARAHATALPSLDEKTLFEEWCREFHNEGLRRPNMIRFNRFYGPKSDENRYNWEGRAAQNDGEMNFKAGTDECLNWFPVPSEDKKANPNFAIDVEGASNNPYASQGGDGYTYAK